MRLSKNFTLEEMTKSLTALALGIENTPDELEVQNLIDLCRNVLQPLRDYYKLPVKVTSGYRSKALNEAVGGSQTSQHSKGQAADFTIPSVDNKEVAKYIQDNLEFDQLILEFYEDGIPNSGWLHCSFNNRGNRKEVLKAYKNSKGKTVYEEISL